MIDLWVPGPIRPSPRPRVTRYGTHMAPWYVAQSRRLADLFRDLEPLPAVPTRVRIDVVIARPPSHWRVKGLAASAPGWPGARAGDVDNIAKACTDPLVKAGTLPDDGQIVELAIAKRYADRSESDGFRLFVSEV